MLRDKSLVPFSHQHQHALALCVRLDRALGKPDTTSFTRWQAEIERMFATEINFHFTAEEQFLFPAASHFEPLRPIVDALLEDHKSLRAYLEKAKARAMGKDELLAFSATLSRHIRTEERELFEGCQKVMPAEELARIGAQTEDFFRSNGVLTNACALPSSLPER
ncbi:MAG: hemerythrin domain-containing protein [Terriglobales bacterium]